MRTVRRDSFTHRDIQADVWKNTLSQIASVYGRLEYLASLRDSNTGVYRHHGLALLFGREEASKALAESHSKVFAEWLGFTLEQQQADLDLYLSELIESRKTVIENWLRGTPYRALPPHSAKRMERKLFFRDLEALLEVMKNALGAGGPSPES